MSNFKFLLSDPAFAPFADVAMAAEKILHIDPAACILNCRRSMEFAVKWMYSVDKELEMPYQDNLQSLMSREEFRAIVFYWTDGGGKLHLFMTCQALSKTDLSKIKQGFLEDAYYADKTEPCSFCLKNANLTVDNFPVFVPSETGKENNRGNDTKRQR